MKELLEKIRRAATEEMSQAGADLEEIRIKYLGKKGELTALLRQMGSLSAEERPVIGQLANEVRSSIEAELDKLRAAAKEKAREAALRAEKIDVTVPGAEIPTGHRHPLDRVQHEIEDIFIGMATPSRRVPRSNWITITSRRSISPPTTPRAIPRTHSTSPITSCSARRPPPFRCA